MDAGKAGINTVTKMINDIVERFVEISDMMEFWVGQISSTRRAIAVSDDLFEEGSPKNVRKGFDSIVKSFEKMFKSTETTVVSLIELVPDIIQITEKGIQKTEKVVNWTARENIKVQKTYFMSVDSNWKNVQLSSKQVNKINQKSLTGIETGIKAYRRSEEVQK